MPSSPSIRPGSTSAVKLFEGEVCPLVWGGFLDRYENAVRAVGVAKKKLKELCAWDEWWRNQLPLIIAERKHLTKDDLVQVSLPTPVNRLLTCGYLKGTCWFVNATMSIAGKLLENMIIRSISINTNLPSA